jgi:putative copper export protein
MFPSLADFLYVTVMLVVGLLCAVVLIGGVNPFESPLLTAILGFSALAAAAHHMYYTRHRYEIEHSRTRLAARERRGF